MLFRTYDEVVPSFLLFLEELDIEQHKCNFTKTHLWKPYSCRLLFVVEQSYILPGRLKTFLTIELNHNQKQGYLWISPCLQIYCILQEGLATHQRNYHWDKRKGEDIQLQSGEQVRAGKRLKTEVGKSVLGRDEASALYKKWSKAHQTRIVPVGQKEDGKTPYVPGIGDR